MDPIRVLVAEDERTMREALVDLVTSSGSTEVVGAARDAEEAIDLAREQRPDVALLDVRMPGGGGPRAAREIKRRSPRTSIVALSAYRDRTSVLEMLKAGAATYLLKDAGPGSILDAIHGSVGDAPLTFPADVLRELTVLPRPKPDDRRFRRIRRVLDEGRLRMVFQPIVDLQTLEILGLEALARFHMTPRRGPAAWFAEAATVGLLSDLELAAVRMALAHLDRLPRNAFLSVNASPETMASPEFHDALATYPYERIVVEVTEHTPIDDYDTLGRALRPLRAHGVRLAVDDAGAGFASLRRVAELDPDLLKLDRTLIDDIGSDRVRQSLTLGLVSVAAQLGTILIAEGIETETQLRALRALGVRCGQGNLLGRPRAIRAS